MITYSFRNSHVRQICLHKIAQRGAVSPLPILRAQCGCAVGLPPPIGHGAIINYDRSFLTRAYPTMKKNNPHTPIMIREALGIEPKVFARYGRPIAMECRQGRLISMDRAWEGEAGFIIGYGLF